MIHLHLLIGHLLVYLEHARVFYERIGFKGTLQFVLRLERVLRRPIRSARLGFGETPPASQFDDIVQFKVEFSSSTLAASRDDVAADLLQSILFGLNWPAAAADRGTVQKFIEDGYEYNGWDKPKSGS